VYKHMKEKSSKFWSILALIIMCGLLLIIVFDLLPLFEQVIAERGDETNAIDYISSYGAKGVPLLAGLSFLQVIFAVIPAAPIQVLSGLCYGMACGSAICLVGSLAGNAFVFLLARQAHAVWPSLATKQSKFSKKMTGLANPELTAFSLYLVPILPNGLLPYIFARTSITFPRFLMASGAAILPSILICSLLGDLLAAGKYIAAASVGCAYLAALAYVMLNKDKISKTLKL